VCVCSLASIIWLSYESILVDQLPLRYVFQLLLVPLLAHQRSLELMMWSLLPALSTSEASCHGLFLSALFICTSVHVIDLFSFIYFKHRTPSLKRKNNIKIIIKLPEKSRTVNATLHTDVEQQWLLSEAVAVFSWCGCLAKIVVELLSRKSCELVCMFICHRCFRIIYGNAHIICCFDCF